ncbi:MAG: rhomboid family intramembrane serine protease [Bacteroidia bacterium]|nr:rhomboid family intramembrane serine protease [Bacteroidia bacterium]
MNLFEELKFKFNRGNAIVRIIMINVLVFIVFGLTNTLFILTMGSQAQDAVQNFRNWFELPASFSRLLYQPWSLFTYMFLHNGFLHLIFNMLWLYWIGQILQQFLGNAKTYVAYLLGGLSGAIAYLVVYNISPFLQPTVSLAFVVGASAAVYAVVFASATLSPDYELSLFLIGPVKLKFIALATILIDLIMIPVDGNAGGHIAHLGGAFFGFLYIKQLYSHNFLSKGFDKLESLFAPKPESNLRVYHRSAFIRKEEKGRPTQEEIDQILDKINSKGISVLSQKERDLLNQFGKDK